uniref:Uncharacterized protein n=2 Tax=Cercopithecidae TaxID=9527 RepID=A0A2K6NP64_RHIRO|nr:unnamed protein product [Macaca fascicularis]
MMSLKTSQKGEAQSHTFIYKAHEFLIFPCTSIVKEFSCINFYFRSRIDILPSYFQVFLFFVFFQRNLIFRCIYCCYYYIYC